MSDASGVPCWNYHRHGEGAMSVDELVDGGLPAVCPECNDTGMMMSKDYDRAAEAVFDTLSWVVRYGRKLRAENDRLTAILDERVPNWRTYR